MLIALEAGRAPAGAAAKSSNEIISLLNEYKPAPDNKKDTVLPGSLRLEPQLIDSYDLELSLRIGYERMYKVGEYTA